jgi:hypothetical protein
MYSILQIGINNDPSILEDRGETNFEFIGEVYHENFIHRGGDRDTGEWKFLYITGHR